MWSLRHALREGRELIHVESAQFAPTARPTGQPTAEQVDLVGEIVTSLTAHPNLRVIICTPRESDFAANYPGWGREHYKARTEAVSNLLRRGLARCSRPLAFDYLDGAEAPLTIDADGRTVDLAALGHALRPKRTYKIEHAGRSAIVRVAPDASGSVPLLTRLIRF